MAAEHVLVLGCGYTGIAVARLARERGQSVLATVRSGERAAALRADAFEVRQFAELDASSVGALVTATTHVIVSFPPDGVTDARIAPALAAAQAISYVSSTGVYGEHRGVVDDQTALPPANARAQRLLAAEEAYRRHGASVLRCPGIYGPERGLHRRVQRGEHRIPGDGMRFLSRIHVADLAQLLLACAAPDARAQTFVVGDLAPAPQIEVVRFICERYGVAMPPTVALEDVHESLRADRQVDATRALRVLGVTLRYPSYREGMAPEATRSGDSAR